MSTTTPMIKLSDILDTDQLKMVDRLAKDIRAGRVDRHELRRYLRSQKESLEARGMLPDYMYYAICYALKLPL